MRIKITLELSGNAFLDLLRRVPKTVAQELKAGASFIDPEKPEADYLEQKDLFSASANQLIESKRR